MKRWRESLLFHPMVLRQLRRRPVSRMSAEDVVVAGPPTAPWRVCLQRKLTLEPGWLRTWVTQVTIQMVQTLRHASSDILEIKCAILPDRRYEKVRPSPSRDFIPGVSWSVERSASGRVSQGSHPCTPNFKGHGGNVHPYKT